MASTRLLAVVVVLAAIGAATCLPHHKKIRLPRMQRSQAIINEYFDQITPQLQEVFIAGGLDPLQLKDHLQTFNVTDPIGIEWHGELGLEKGWMTDLSVFQRSGDAYVNYDDLELNITVTLAFPDAALTYDFKAQIMDIGPEGAVHGKTEDLLVQLVVHTKLPDVKLEIYEFEFLDYGKVTFHLEGIGLELIENALLDVVTTLFRGPIMDFMEVRMREVIGDALANIDLGGIGVFSGCDH